MKARPVTLFLLGILAFAACQPAPPTAPPVDTAGTQTRAAAVLQSGQTSTAAAQLSAAGTMTAAAPTPTSTPQPTPTVRRLHLSVDADACWISTGVKLSAGETLEIVAAGEVNTWNGREGSTSGPEGVKGLCGDVKCPLRGASYGALIGRIGEGDSFLVGPRLEFTAQDGGDLYLTVNDWQCTDNSGSFPVRITFR